MAMFNSYVNVHQAGYNRTVNHGIMWWISLAHPLDLTKRSHHGFQPRNRDVCLKEPGVHVVDDTQFSIAIW